MKNKFRLLGFALLLISTSCAERYRCWDGMQPISTIETDTESLSATVDTEIEKEVIN